MDANFCSFVFFIKNSGVELLLVSIEELMLWFGAVN